MQAIYGCFMYINSSTVRQVTAWMCVVTL